MNDNTEYIYFSCKLCLKMTSFLFCFMLLCYCKIRLTFASEYYLISTTIGISTNSAVGCMCRDGEMCWNHCALKLHSSIAWLAWTGLFWVDHNVLRTISHAVCLLLFMLSAVCGFLCAPPPPPFLISFFVNLNRHVFGLKTVNMETHQNWSCCD